MLRAKLTIDLIVEQLAQAQNEVPSVFRVPEAPDYAAVSFVG
jgi:hypothetical protein